MKPNDFLAFSGQHYEELKKKWANRLKKAGLTFSEDIYNDSIIKVYEQLNKKEYTGDIEAYWYQAFLTNTKRDTKYAYHKKDDSIDVLKYLDEFPADDRPMPLEDIQDILRSMENNKNFHLFLIYYMTDITINELEELTGIKGVRYKIRGIINTIKERIKK